MNKDKQTKLAATCWKIGSIDNFLQLTATQATYIELRVMFSKHLKHCWSQKQLTLNEFAQLINANPALLEKLEIGDAAITLDFLISSLLILGVTVQELAEIMADCQDFADNPS